MFFEILIILVVMVVGKFCKKKLILKFGLKFMLVVKFFFKVDESGEVVCRYDLLILLLILFNDVLNLLVDFLVVDLEEIVELMLFGFGVFILFMKFVFCNIY